MYYNINMEQQQEFTPEDGKTEGGKNAKNGSGVIRGLLGKGTLLVAGLLGAGGAAGCGGGRPEAPKPLDVCVIMVAPEKPHPPEGMAGEVVKKDEKKEKKEDAEHWKDGSLSVIGEHVLSDGRYYLKTVEVEGGKRVAVWELLEGDTPSAMKPPPRIAARIDEKGGRLDFDGHIYFKAVDPGAWERGRGKAKDAVPPSLSPSPKPMEEKISPLEPYELTKVLYGSATVHGNRLTVIDTKGMYHEFSFHGGLMPPMPSGHYPIQGVLHAVPGEKKGHRSIFLAVGWSTLPAPRMVVRIPPTVWEWLETGPMKK